MSSGIVTVTTGVSSGDTSPQIDSILYGVSCPSETFCAAVGRADTSTDTETLIEMWDGSSWSVVTSPSPANNFLEGGVSCTSPTFCVAVGDSNATTTLITANGGATIATGQTFTANGQSNFVPSGTNGVSITTDADSFLTLLGLTSPASSTASLCLDGSNNVIKCPPSASTSSFATCDEYFQVGWAAQASYFVGRCRPFASGVALKGSSGHLCFG